MPDEPYQFGSEQDLRNVIQLLVNAHKLWQSRALTLDRILNGIMAQSPTKRANLTVRDIDTITRQIQPIVDAEVQLKAEQVERKLKDGDYLNAVRIYASQQFWK
jgi:hypothetical protein